MVHASTLHFTKHGVLVAKSVPYEMTLADIEQAFGSQNHTRRNVFAGLQQAVLNLWAAGVTRVVVGGSFVSTKEHPRDADIAWWVNDRVDYTILDAVFLSKERREARGKFLVDQKVDGVFRVPLDATHEYFLRTNRRLPEGEQDVGIVLIIRGGQP